MKTGSSLGILLIAALTQSMAVGVAPAPIELPAETASLKSSALPGYAIASSKCVICHSVDYINYQPPGMTLTQWTAEVLKMQRVYGAPLDEAEAKLVATYLESAYGASTVSPAGN